MLLTVTGCSRISILYRTADLFIEQYADDYLSLDGNQLASWNPKLADALARHRREELPHLAAFFDGFLEATREGLKTTNTTCLIDAFEGLYRRQFRLASGVAAPLLASLQPQQIRALEAKFAEDARKAARKSGSPSAQHLRKRAERWSKSAVWWIGPLNGEQRGIIREVTAALPNTSAAWAAYRKDRQAGLIRLLDGRAKEARIRRYLTNWLAYHRKSDPTTAEGAARDPAPARAPLHASGRQLQPDPTGPLQGPARRPAGRFHEDSEILTHGAPEMREVRSIAAASRRKIGA